MNMEEVIREEARKIISPVKYPTPSLAWDVGNVLLKQNEEIKRFVKGLAYGEGYKLLNKIIESELKEKFKPANKENESTENVATEFSTIFNDLLNQEIHKGEIRLLKERITEEINKALDEKDSAKFYSLTNSLKELQSEDDELITS